MSSTAAPARRYRWTILSAGVVAQAANSAILLGSAAIAPALRRHYGLTLTQVGVVLAAVSFGSVVTPVRPAAAANRPPSVDRPVPCADTRRRSPAARRVPVIVVPALVLAGTFALSWNGLSFTAAAEAAGPARSGVAIGLQQTFLSAGSIVASIAFATLVHAGSWRVAFGCAAS